MEINQNVDEQAVAPNKSKDWPFSYFALDYKRDSPDGVRSAILVVAALVATSSFQAMMDPPDFITKKQDSLEQERFLIIFFTCSTTLAFSSAMTIIETLTASFPFQREIRMSYVAMGLAFGLAATELGKSKATELGKSKTAGDVPSIPFLVCISLPWASRWVPIYIKRVWNCVFRC